MNPPEGAAEEGGAADSDVDAFFRTGRLGRARAAAGRAASCLGQVWGSGAVAAGVHARWGAVPTPPRRPGWSCRDSCCDGNAGSVSGVRGGELGARRPLAASTPLAGVCGGDAGGGSLGCLPRSARGWGDVGSLCSAPARAPGVPLDPGDPLPCPPSPSACQPGSDRPGLSGYIWEATNGCIFLPPFPLPSFHNL